jgi:hypothetical protein
MATNSFRRNTISQLVDDNGLLFLDHESKENLLWTSYKNKMGISLQPYMQFDLQLLISLNADLSPLVAPFSKEEIDRIVRIMPPDKAPGHDGFNGLFLKKCWSIIKEDFYRLCFDFFDVKLDLKSSNNSFITLILKINNPEIVNDFRPNSLLNTCMKLITKLLGERLQRFILQLLHKNQYGFIKHRTIQDCLAWCFEFIHQRHQSKREIIILKLDFAKGFDTIEHSAMLVVMQQMGFPSKWMQWMSLIFSPGVSSILLNGVPGKQFKCKRGVRQGDPFLPCFLS